MAGRNIRESKVSARRRERRGLRRITAPAACAVVLLTAIAFMAPAISMTADSAQHKAGAALNAQEIEMAVQAVDSADGEASGADADASGESGRSAKGQAADEQAGGDSADEGSQDAPSAGSDGQGQGDEPAAADDADADAPDVPADGDGIGGSDGDDPDAVDAGDYPAEGDVPEGDDTGADAVDPDAAESGDAADPDADPAALAFAGELKDGNGKVALAVEVEAQAGALPKGTTMQLAPVKGDDVADAVDGALADAADRVAGGAADHDAEFVAAAKANAKVKGIQAVDISFVDADGNEVEPAEPITVRLASKQIKKHVEGEGAKSAESVAADAGVPEDVAARPMVVHIADDGTADVVDVLAGEQLEQRDLPTAAKDEIVFDSGAFSVYAIVYTVDFHWEIDGKTYDFSIPGGGFVSLSQLVEALGIANQDAGEDSSGEEKKGADETAEAETALTLEGIVASDKTWEFIEQVEKVEFSTPELMSVSKVEENTTVEGIIDELKLEINYSRELGWKQIEKIRSLEVAAGDWALIALKPFKSNETLTITMKNGDELVVSVTDYAQYDPVEDPGVNIPNPNGTVMNLFDYWVDKDLKDNAGKYAWPGYNGSYYSTTNHNSQTLSGNGNNSGINSWSGNTNEGHALKFNPSDQYTVIDGIYDRNGGTNGWNQRSENYARRINSWVGNADPLQGLVESTLNNNGYPKLTNNSTLGTNGEDLDYLFDGTQGEDMGKKVYPGVDGLLYVDKDGYYTYDSRDFAASYDANSNRFNLSAFADNVSGGPRGFWPFGSEKFWVGLHMKVDFSMPTNGQVLNPNGEYKDMTFSFSGDDDTWIYVDGILVGDGGGVHNRTQIDINFKTGTVYITGKNDPDYTGSMEQTRYLDDIMGAYANDGTYDTDKWQPYLDASGNQVLHTSGSNSGRPVLVFKDGSHHDLQMFYLERGGGFSNLMIHYNLISTTDISAHKSYHNTDDSVLHRNDYRFELIGYDNTSYSGEAVKAIMPNSETYDASKELGTFENPEKYHVDASGGQPGYSYVLIGNTEDGNVNFGNLREFSNADVGKEYRYVVREWVPPTAENEDGIQWQDATDEQKAEGGFVDSVTGITYDSRVYYFIGRVEETSPGSGEYDLVKYRYLDPGYTIPDTETKFFSFVNGKELPLTLKVNKKDAEDNLLSGAKFSLTRAMKDDNDKWVRRHWTVNTGGEDQEQYSELRTATTSQGVLTFGNLKEGHYILEETDAPAGYEKGSQYRWLLTLTKVDSATEIVLVPTIQAIDAEGNVVGTVEELNVQNHVADFNVLNTPVPPLTIEVNKSWLGADNEPLDPSEYSEYSAKFELRRTKSWIETTQPDPVDVETSTLRIGYYAWTNNSNEFRFSTETYTFVAGTTAYIPYSYHNNYGSGWDQLLEYCVNQTAFTNLNRQGTIEVTMPPAGQTSTVYFCDSWRLKGGGSAARACTVGTVTGTRVEDIPQEDPQVIEHIDEPDDDFSCNSVILENGVTSGAFVGPLSGGKFPSSEIIGGILYTYKYYIVEVEKPGGFETIYIDDSGNVVPESNLEDLASTGGQQTVINRKLMEVPVTKYWPDMNGDAFTWEATFHLEFREVKVNPEDENAGDAVLAFTKIDGTIQSAIPELASIDPYVVTVSKSNPSMSFSGLPMYRMHSNGTLYRIEYSVDETSYTLWEDGVEVSSMTKNDGSPVWTGDESLHYTPQYEQDAGEYGSALEDYEIIVINTLQNITEKQEIDITVQKSWPDVPELSEDEDAYAKFALKRYVHEEYTSFGSSVEEWVDITLDLGDGKHQKLHVPKNWNMYILGAIKAGEGDVTIEFSDGESPDLITYEDDNSSGTTPKSFAIPFTADRTKTVKLESGYGSVVGGRSGFRLTDMIDPTNMTQPTLDGNFIEEFTLSLDNSWSKTFPYLPAVEEDSHDENALNVTRRVYTYFFEEIECQPSNFTASFEDGDGLALGDINNQIGTEAVVSAKNRQMTADILLEKVDVSDINEENRETLKNAEFRIEKYTSAEYQAKDTSWGTNGEQVFEDDGSGTFSLDGLKVGFYKIVETKCPAGYIQLSTSPTFEVRLITITDQTTGKKTSELQVFALDENGQDAEDNQTEMLRVDGFTIILGNEPGVALPHTGGPGAVPIYLLGTALIGLAGAILVTRRRRSNVA